MERVTKEAGVLCPTSYISAKVPRWTNEHMSVLNSLWYSAYAVMFIRPPIDLT